VKIKLDQDIKNNSTNIVMLGKISTGKSSLLNKLFGLKLKVGVGETTTKAD
jgi:predicted GTPase